MARNGSKRSENGSGCISKRVINGQEYWVGRYTVCIDPGTGKQKQKSIYGKTQKEVREKLREATHQLDIKAYIEPSKMTVGEWLDEFEKTYCSDLTEGTRSKYDVVIRRYLKPSFGNVKLQELDSHQIQKAMNSMRKTRKGSKSIKADKAERDDMLSRKTLIDIKGVIHAAMEKAFIAGYIHSNPVDRVTIPKTGRKKKEITVLTKKQIDDFLNVIRDSEYEMIFKISLFTGLREGEIMGLQWNNIDFENGIITIDHQLKRTKEAEYYIDETKTHEIRKINPGENVLKMLKQQKKIQAERKLKAGSLWDDGGFPGLVFTNEFGQHYGKNTLYHNVQKYTEMIGVNGFRFHDLRHSFAVSYLAAGGDIYSLSKVLGHSTIKLTCDTYLHFTDDLRKQASKNMDDFMQGLVNL